MSDEELEYKERITGLFNRVAPKYDHVGPRFFSHFGRRLVELAQMPSGVRVLDVACGRGAVLFPAAEQVGPEGQVIGIDLSETMVEETRRVIDRLGLKNAQVRQMDAEELDFRDGSFDFVLCGLSLFFFPRLEQALSEFYRVLKPQGIIAASTFGEDRDGRWNWRDELVEAYKPELKPGSPLFARALDTSTELRQVLSRAGFIGVQTVSQEEEFFYRDEDEWWSSLWSHGRRALLERMEPSVLQRFKADAFDAITLLKGSGGLPIFLQVLFATGTKPQ